MDFSWSADFWKIVLPALGAILAWIMNERSKLAWEQYKRKEVNYSELLKCSRGFYIATQDRDLKNQFLNQVNLLWLYAPDNVIRLAYEFLATVITGADAAAQARKEQAYGDLMEAIRKDLLARGIVRKSHLKSRDFRHFTAT